MSERRVLVVEDDETLSRAIVMALRQRGYDAVSAATLGAALVCAHDDFPSLLILDIGLPDGDGWTLLEAMQRSNGPPSLRVVVISSNRVPRSRLREQGVFRFLPKPFDMGELMDTVRRALEETGGSSSCQADDRV